MAARHARSRAGPAGVRRPSYTPRALRKSKAIRAAAWAVVAAGVAAPLVRRRMRLPKPAVLADRGRRAGRDLRRAPAHARARRRRLRAADVGLPGGVRDAARRPGGARAARADRLPGAGRPRARARRAADAAAAAAAVARPGEMRRFEKVLVWTHWVWFAVPHAATAYVLVRERERFGRAAATTYAVFDLGARRLLAAADRAAVVRGRAEGGSATTARRRCGG